MLRIVSSDVAPRSTTTIIFWEHRSATAGTGNARVFLVRHLKVSTLAVSHIVVDSRTNNFNVLWTIIRSNSVDVVWDLARTEPTTQQLLGDKAMLIGVPAAIGEVMFHPDTD